MATELARLLRVADLVEQEAALLARSGGEVQAVDVAWKLRRILADPYSPEAQVSYTDRGIASLERHLRTGDGEEPQ